MVIKKLFQTVTTKAPGFDSHLEKMFQLNESLIITIGRFIKKLLSSKRIGHFRCY